ncbi:MAG TPA: YdeI/OmpD-associated family protein [Longimicrobium sp.]|nr:YdeI/OmpD-associated family protein [Longimicrobium sp.]
MPNPPENSVHPATRDDWRAWLQQNHARTEGIWFVSYKKAAGKPRVTYEDAVEEALCFGWIDSKGGTVDDERTMLWMAPRKPRTGWSRPNKERIERLVAEGRMAPAGLAKIEAAKKDGSWTLLDASEALEMPPELEDALAAYPDAARNFAAFPPSARKAILQWISLARKPETRAARIAETARLANENVRANQWRPKENE